MMDLVYAAKDLLYNSTSGAVNLPSWSIVAGGMAVIMPILVKLLSLLPWHTLVEKFELVLRPMFYGLGVAVSVWLVKVFGSYGASIEEFFENNVPKAVIMLWGWFCDGLNSDDKPAITVTPAPPVDVKK